MAEYIEREATCKECVRYGMGEALCADCVVKVAPAADVVPAVHGRWLDTREFCGDYMCSNCAALYGTNKFNYCPNCGARMDGE